MKITVNDTELIIFEGAKVKDAVRLYYTQQDEHLPEPMPVVTDAFGHKIGIEGTLLPNTAIFIHKKKKETATKKKAER